MGPDACCAVTVTDAVAVDDPQLTETCAVPAVPPWNWPLPRLVSTEGCDDCHVHCSPAPSPETENWSSCQAWMVAVDGLKVVVVVEVD